MNKRLTILILFLCEVLSAQQNNTPVTWPVITSENKPWTRWWWPGSIVSKSDLTINMEKYRKAGIGGMEITVIYGVKGMEDKFINYLSPEWMQMFTHTLREGERLNLGIELANASGWPFGGPWVKPDDACRNINYKTWTLNTGERLTDSVWFIQKPLIRAIGLKPDIKKLSDPIASNDSLQIYALDQIRFRKPIPLQVLMAYSDNGQSLDLTDRVDPQGKLDWTAPDGKWTLWALFEGWHGKQVERAGPGGEGDVIDHFSSGAIDNYLDHFDEAFRGYDIKSLHGFFNDSYEVDDSYGQANWTPLLFDEFKKRRGYELRENIPALFQKDINEKNERVLSDFRQTISDLLLENYTQRWTAWANKQGKTTRNQSHGAPANILDLYAATDIPETEGTDLTRLKFATSAGNVSGKKYISSESGTWLNEHFSSDLSDVKKAVDQFFIAGVNHIFYHGTCYSPVNQPWPGFQFYASVEFSPQNSFWNDFACLNNYVAHVQSFLQKGRPDNDILLYFPVFDRFSDYGRDLLEHFDAVSPAFNGTPFRKAADDMLSRGFSYDYISDLQLKNTNTKNGILQTSGGEYKTIIVPGCKYIPLETFEKVLNLAADGGKVIFFNNMPENIAGWSDYVIKTKRFEEIKTGLKFASTGDEDIKSATYGKGSILIGKDLDKLLSAASIKREPMVENSLKFNRRKSGNGYTYFVVNTGPSAFHGWLKLGKQAPYAALFNSMTGESGISNTRTGSDGLTEIYAEMKPDESIIIETFNTKITGKAYNFFEPGSPSKEITGLWKIEFIEGGPELPPVNEITKLISWTRFEGDSPKNFSGTARYTVSFEKPAAKADKFLLDLGKVCNSVRIKLNGEEIATLIGPEFSLLLDKSRFKTVNTLELEVSNLMANRIAYLDRTGVEWKKFYNINFAARLKENTRNGIFDASAWQPRESGLLGPMTITAMKKHQ